MSPNVFPEFKLKYSITAIIKKEHQERVRDWPCAIISVFKIVFLFPNNLILVNINSARQVSEGVVAWTPCGRVANV